MKFRRHVYDQELIQRAVHEYNSSNLSADEISIKYGIYRGAIFYHRKKQQEGGGSQNRAVLSKEEYLYHRKNKKSQSVIYNE